MRKLFMPPEAFQEDVGCEAADHATRGIPEGCEAVATRRFIESMPDGFVVAELDFVNAFNSLHRDAMLQTVADSVPDIYNFCDLSTSSLQLSSSTDLNFSLAKVRPLLISTSDLTIGVMDDVTVGGHADTVAGDVEMFRTKGTGWVYN